MIWNWLRILTLVLIVTGPLDAQSARDDIPLKAEDLGMTKWVFQATPAKSQVAVFRAEQLKDNKVVSAQDLTIYTAGEQTSQEVVFINKSFFHPEPVDSWVIKTKAEMTAVSGQFVGSSFDLGGKGVFKLDVTENGKLVHQVFKYTIFLKSYAEAKKAHPQIPDAKDNVHWAYWTALEDNKGW